MYLASPLPNQISAAIKRARKSLEAAMTLDSGAWVIIAASPISMAELYYPSTQTKKEGQEEPPFFKVRPI
jgi:hypothetical protein